ncbi:hypothetical protein E5E91_01270 [Deinococcus radiodurans R1 = ATCC 13939 = DSM 20539]|nr:hypothetical protein DXG80_10865 [Deinococcus radiodurans]UDK99446.1 hypothetical protein E5E91_01270 [Deinococcus radiodurans R1 = ATCC 13939 = DSM 20539]
MRGVSPDVLPHGGQSSGLIRFQIEPRTCPGVILRGAHGKNTVLRRWAGIRRLSGCSGIG